MRGRLLDARRGARGAVEDEARHAARHVEQHEARDLRVGEPQAARQLLEQRPRDARHLLHLAAELVAAQHEQHGGLHRDDVRGARLAVDQRELAEVVALAERAEDHLAPVLPDDGDLHGARAHDVERIARVALPDDQRAARVALLADEGGEAAALVRRQALEERHIAEELGDAW